VDGLILIQPTAIRAHQHEITTTRHTNISGIHHSKINGASRKSDSSVRQKTINIYHRQDVPNICCTDEDYRYHQKRERERERERERDPKQRHRVLVESTLTTAYIYIKDASARVDALSGS
jgi:hypothetical protein